MKITEKLASKIIISPIQEFKIHEFWLKLFWNLFIMIDCWSFKQSQNFNQKKIEEIRKKRLIKILNFARDNSQYWKDKISEKVNEDNVYDIFRSLPILSRETLKNSDLGILAVKNIRPWRLEKIVTSGTTSIPMEFFGDKVAYIRLEAAVKGIIGLSKNTRLMRANLKFPPYRPLGKLALFSQADETYARKVISKHIKKYKPSHVFAPTSTLLDMAYILPATNNTFHSVWAVGEHILDKDKAFIEEKLGCPLYSIYASREAGGPIAFECSERKGLHINENSFFVEVLDGKNLQVAAGQEGEIVLTMFDNKAFPFIRYKIGDRGVLSYGKCECGRLSPRIELRGREMHFVKLKNGKEVSLLSVVGLIRNKVQNIKQYQFIQTDFGKITGRIVTTDELKINGMRIAEAVKKRFGSLLEITLEPADRINGKNILFINNISSEENKLGN